MSSLLTQKFLPSLNLNKIKTRFSFGTVEDPKLAVIRAALVHMELDLQPGWILQDPDENVINIARSRIKF
jgi:hypothetical protein